MNNKDTAAKIVNGLDVATIGFYACFDDGCHDISSQSLMDIIEKILDGTLVMVDRTTGK